MRVITPLQAAFRGVELQVVRVTDETGRDWIERAYLGQSGVSLEDGGGKAGRYTLELVFNGPTWRANLNALKVAVEQSFTSSSELVHPFWGRMEGEVTAFQVTHEDRAHDHARATLTFVEGARDEVMFDATDTLQTALAAATAALDGAEAALAALAGT